MDPDRFNAWVWKGSEASIKKKVLGAKLALSIKDNYRMGMRSKSVDDGKEPNDFNVMFGLEEEVRIDEIQTGPVYTGKEKDLLLEHLTAEKILLVLKKTDLPSGYKRGLVLVNNTLFRYVEEKVEYAGKSTSYEKLVPIQEEIRDGPYFLENYFPRFLFSLNKLVLTEYLEKMTPEEMEKEDLIQKKLSDLKKQSEGIAT